MDRQFDNKLLGRYRDGLLDEKDYHHIYSLFSKQEENSDFKQYLQKEFDEYLNGNLDEDLQISHIFDRVHHQIRLDKEPDRKFVKRLYSWYSAAAAVLLIPMLILGAVWLTKLNRQNSMILQNEVVSTLIAPLGARINFSLPDGTSGWLNSGSSLEYRLPFNQDRQVSLEGEAWFDVAHDSDHPFEVTAGESKVKVLGTKFNLNAYPEEGYVEVVLEQGKIQFLPKGQAMAVDLKPDERLVLSDGAINISATEAQKYTAWIEGKLIFRSDPMLVVARRIGRWYNVDVELVDEELKGNVIRGTFQDDSLEEVLHFLSMTTPIRYQIIEKEEYADGTVPKKKVLLYSIDN